MAANTFLEMSRSLRLYVPDLPLPLAEQFIRDRYRRILEARDWSALRRESEFILNALKDTGTVDVLRGDDQVVGTDTTFEESDTGRQFKAGVSSPVYTITAVDVSGQALTLDRDFGGESNSAATFQIFDGYVTPPDDFLRFIDVVDPSQGWRLRHWVTSKELMLTDPQRTFFGQPYVLADRMYSAGGRPQYEAWPYSNADRTLYYTYVARVPDLIQDDDVPIWPIRSDVIVAGALSDAARWPGTAESPNPYYQNANLWKSYESEYVDKLVEIERRDEDIYISMLEQWPFSNYQLAPMSASFIQTHAI